MNGRVLIVDDSLTVRMDLAEAFEKAGLLPTLCTTIAEGREALAAQRFDVAVLDLQLPDGEGTDLLKEVRQSASAKGMVMMLSTEAEIGDRIRGLKKGADDYIGKPYDATDVVARAHAFLRTKRSEEDSPEITVLVIDDSATFRNELRERLSAAGFRVIEAASGEEGLRIAASQRPDAMVVDGTLPGIDGMTVIRRVRDDLALRGTPCLLLTASEDRGDELRALDAGADTFVRKSDTLDVILARLQAVLRRAPQRPEHDVASLLEPRRLLVVDDSETFRDELAKIFRGEGYELILARSGGETLALLAVQAVDCILITCTMPDMSGLDLCRRIKGAPATRDVPILMLTEQEDSDAIVEGLRAGADDYMSKAGDFRFLRARIAAQLRHKQTADEQRRIRDQIRMRELEAAEARAVRDIAQVRAALADELSEKNALLAVAKERLEDYARTLEDRVRERTQRLLAVEQQLRHVQKMEAIGQLTGGIAHDFNNLLGIVTGNLDLLIEHLERDPEGLDLANEALKGALRGATLTQRLLAFARKQPLKPALCNLNEALGEMEPMLRRTLQENIEIRFLPAADLWATFCDKHQVEDAILNLAINARDAMPGGGKLVIETANAMLDESRVEVGVDVAAGNYVMLAVSDTGTGMPPDVIERAFDPFFTAKAAGKGTGLGLSMVYGFAKQSGGNVKIYSEVGHGTTIRLYLPQAGEPDGAAVPERATNARAQGSAGDETVLVVEDDFALRQVAVRMMSDLGYNMLQAEGPEEALAVLETNPDIALVFTDIVMPGEMTGIELAEKIRAMEHGAKVLLTTGYSEGFVRGENGHLSGADFLAKPYRKQDLANKVRQMLDEASAL